MKTVRNTVKYCSESGKLTEDEIKTSVKLLCQNDIMVLFDYKNEFVNEKKELLQI